MKRLFILIAAIAATAAAGAQKSIVDCTFDGLEKSMRIVVSQAQGGRLVPTDTLTPDNKGHIRLERAVADPLMLALSLTKSNSPYIHVIVLPKENISLSVNYMPALNHFDITSTKGSDNMELYKKFTNLVTNAYLDERPGATATIIEHDLESILSDNPSVLMSAFLVTYYEKSYEQHVSLYKKIRDALIDKWPNNEFVQHLDSRLRTTLLPGMEAPDIALPDRDGNTRRLSDLRGKVVLIDFWASWCRPCRMENPNVVRLYEQYHDKGFEIFSVSLDNNRDAWLKAINDDRLSWPNHVSDLRGWSSAGGRLYGIQSIPSTVLVDAKGNILARNLRGQELENKLKEIFTQ